MAYNVKFLKGTAAQYSALASKDANTFYFTSDDSKLYLGTIELSTPKGVAAAIALVNNATKGNEALYSAIQTLNGDVSTNGSVAKAIDDKVKAILGSNADLSTLTTDAKTIIAAINELDAAIDTIENAGKVTIEKSTSVEGIAARYTVKQGGTALPVTIDIPSDMVVESGEVVVNPQGQPAGTYIKLVLANAAEDELYINVGTLVDIYTAQQSATQVQLAINSSTREISATIVAGSITSTELAADAVTTAKIVDGNVTTAKIANKAVTDAKLSDEVNASLAKADSAVQSIVEGSTNGTVSVDGTNVSVHGLGSAAYTNSTAYDAAGSAATAQSNAEAYTDTALTWGTLE